MSNQRFILFSTFIFVLPLFFSCNIKPSEEKSTFSNDNPKARSIEKYISCRLDSLEINPAKIYDSSELRSFKVLKEYYSNRNFRPLWSDSLKWLKAADNFIAYLDTSIRDGLFKEDYNYTAIRNLYFTTKNDSLFKFCSSLLADAEILMTDALVGVLRDLKQGRLQQDSLCWENLPDKYDYFFTQIEAIEKGKTLQEVFDGIQPKISEYHNLRNGIKKFVDSMSVRKYTYVNFPFKNGDLVDSLLFIEKLHRRLIEEGFTKYSHLKIPDSLTLAEEVNWYRKKFGLSDEKLITGSIIKNLNFTDQEKLLRIAITLDKFKQLNASMPPQYICVNLPGFHLRLMENDSTKLYSKIICGKPSTRTPLINSAINEIITYPTWTVPSSIVSKEMLPGLKRDSDYLRRKGLNLFDKYGTRINPGSVDWSKYKTAIPYKIQQASGDDNALGVIKFNFPNDFSVYLHDTNQRYLFGKKNRALSHGCVRVQEWKNLALYLIKNDSMKLSSNDTLSCNSDSLQNWIAKKQRHKIPIKNAMPVFIWYHTCEGIDDKISFYTDIYDEDKVLRDTYFAKK